jgi:hypothetical protein
MAGSKDLRHEFRRRFSAMKNTRRIMRAASGAGYFLRYGSTVGLGQVTVGGMGSRATLLNPLGNINAMAKHLAELQSGGLIDPSRPSASLAT